VLAQVRNRHGALRDSTSIVTVSRRITAAGSLPTITIGTPCQPSVSAGASTLYCMLSDDDRGGGKHGAFARLPSRPVTAYCGNSECTTVTWVPAGKPGSGASKHKRVPDES